LSTLNALPFPIDANSVPYYDNVDTNGYLTMPTEQYIRVSGLFLPVSVVNPLPSSDAIVQATLTSILEKLITSPATEAKQDTIQNQIISLMGGKNLSDLNNNLISLSNNKTQDVIFHDEAVTAADGTIFTVTGYKLLTIEIYGTSTSRTVAFIGRGASGIDRDIIGENLTTHVKAISTIGTGELWQINIAGLTSVFIDLQAVAGGNVSIKGTAVA